MTIKPVLVGVQASKNYAFDPRQKITQDDIFKLSLQVFIAAGTILWDSQIHTGFLDRQQAMPSHLLRVGIT